MKTYKCDIAIVGAGIIGIATAYYLKKLSRDTSVVLIDSEQAMSFTSAQSGENYRNWWPHPVMTAFTDRSIDLMEELATQTNNILSMNRRGYVLATRNEDVDDLMRELVQGYSQLDHNEIRIHDSSTVSYSKPTSRIWQEAPSGVDILKNKELIRQTFPSYGHDVDTVVHIRRAGAISAQQMGQWMLDRYNDEGGLRVHTEVSSIDFSADFNIKTKNRDVVISAERVINAAGPFISDIANMLGTRLPVTNTLQQKIAFEDTAKVIPRDMPFSIDLDAQHIDWSEEEFQLLSENSDHRWLTEQLPGSIHCRPDGGDNGSWIKLGWAFNDTPSQPVRDPELLASYPEIVLRGAARLNPGLKKYYDHLPWPLAPRAIYALGWCWNPLFPSSLMLYRHDVTITRRLWMSCCPPRSVAFCSQYTYINSINSMVYDAFKHL